MLISIKGDFLVRWGMSVATDFTESWGNSAFGWSRCEGIMKTNAFRMTFQHVQNSSSDADVIKPSAVGHLTHNPSAIGKYCLSKPKTGRKYVFIRPFQINAGCSCCSG